MADAQLDIVLSAKDMSQQAFSSLNNNVKGIGGSLDSLKAAFSGIATGYSALRVASQALESAKLGSTLEKQAAAFSNLSEAAGSSSKRMLESLKASSQGLIADAELMGSAGKALLMNIPADKISELMKIAAATSKMTGQSMTEAFADITMGVARQSKMILDNLGIIVDVDKANKDYALSLGKTSEALTDTEKRQAFMNAVLKAGDDMIKRLGTSSGELKGVNQLVAAQTNLWNEVNKTVAAFLDKELSGYAKMLNWIDEKLKGMRSSAGESSMKDAAKEIEMLRSLESKGMAQPGSTMNKMAEYNRRWGGASEAELANQSAMQRYKSAEASKFVGSSRVLDNQIPYDVDARWKAFEQELKKEEDATKAEIERTKRMWDDYKPRYSESQRSEAELADEKAYDDWKKSWEPWASKQRLPESQRSEAELADEKAMVEYKEKMKNEFNAMNELSAETARAMQSNFSTFFFDGMTGEFKSLNDYATAMFRSIQKAAADMAGQFLTQKLFGTQSTGGTAGGGGWLQQMGSWIGTLFQSGSTATAANGLAFDRSGMVAFARGGVVDRPTVFPFARGVGLMGEAGPEAIMPLRRDASGRLGISAGGQSTNNVTINVAAPGGRMDRESLNHLQTALFASLQRAGQRNS